MKTLFVTLAFVFLFSEFKGQDLITVAENTFKVAGMTTETFYYGFAKGDKIVISFEEVNGKEMKEIQVYEYPAVSKFMEYKASKFENKTIDVLQTGVYKFDFYNSAVAGRVCKIKIQRIPESLELKNFNTAVYWETVYDTSYYTVNEEYLVSRDTIVTNITDQVAKVHSSTNLNGNKTTFNFTLPANTVAWSYYVGVDQEGQDAFNKASKELALKAGTIVGRIPGYGPLAALALDAVPYLATLQKGEDIDYYIVQGENVNLFLSGEQFYYVKKGKVINDFSKMTTPLTGSFHFCLYNDNAVTAVEVTVKVTAVSINEQWGTRPVKKMSISSHKEPYLKN